MNLVFISAMVYAASSFRVCLFGLMLVTKLVACFRMMGGHRKWLYWLLAIMWPLFSFLIHMSLFRTSEWAMWEMGETLIRNEGSCSVSFFFSASTCSESTTFGTEAVVGGEHGGLR